MDFLDRLAANLRDGSEAAAPPEEGEVPPLRLFVNWLEANPEPNRPDWEPLRQAVLSEIRAGREGIQPLLESAGFEDAQESFSRVLEALDWLEEQLEAKDGDLSPDAWSARLQLLLEERARWETWQGQAACPECRRLNPIGWNTCAHCGARLGADEPERDWRESGPRPAELPPELVRLTELARAWRAGASAVPLQEHLAGLKARYEAAVRQLGSAPDGQRYQGLRTALQGAVQAVAAMNREPLQWTELDRGYRQLCAQLAEANQAMAELHQM